MLTIVTKHVPDAANCPPSGNHDGASICNVPLCLLPYPSAGGLAIAPQGTCSNEAGFTWAIALTDPSNCTLLGGSEPVTPCTVDLCPIGLATASDTDWFTMEESSAFYCDQRATMKVSLAEVGMCGIMGEFAADLSTYDYLQTPNCMINLCPMYECTYQHIPWIYIKSSLM